MLRLSDELLDHCLVIAGPTASGKSAVAMEVADRRPCEIVALDSMTLYRGMDIGTAKPSADDRAAVPHHLLDVVDPHEDVSVAMYVEWCLDACEAVVSRGNTPLLVGGSGLYLRSLLRGLFDGPPADSVVRARLEQEAAEAGANDFHSRLARVDPWSATRISPNDVRRVVRAMEVFEVSGRRMSDWHAEDQPRPSRTAFWIDGPRPWLHERINCRVDEMLESGWIEEAERLLGLDRPPGQTAGQALGYPELFAVVRDESDTATATRRIKERTRQFAKRQCTWFRNLSETRRIELDGVESAADVAARLLDRVSV